MEAAVKAAVDTHDSIGGLDECTCTNMPKRLGEPFFDAKNL
ncbi:MAG: chorismate synthase [Bacteroidales bacterium]|nr:chorismate synthase [Bacteroidales bacterium]